MLTYMCCFANIYASLHKGLQLFLADTTYFLNFELFLNIDFSLPSFI